MMSIIKCKVQRIEVMIWKIIFFAKLIQNFLENDITLTVFIDTTQNNSSPMSIIKCKVQRIEVMLRKIQFFCKPYLEFFRE